MAKAESSFKKIIGKLEAYYGRPVPPKLSDPLHLILFESIGYLVEDSRRELAFEALRKQVGLSPEQIMAAPIQSLIAIAGLGGIHPDIRARRLKEIALIIVNEFAG